MDDEPITSFLSLRWSLTTLEGLGSCRLEINGLGPGGDQPFSNSDRTIHAVVNGELYDHHRIRDDMVKLSGFKFRGGSDSEIVIALYEYYGLSFLSKLRGEFALCIYDSRKELFLAARDRSGIKPLFWTIHDGRILLASEAKALLPFDWRPEWDVRSIIDKGWFTEERTLFKGLRKVSSSELEILESYPRIDPAWSLHHLPFIGSHQRRTVLGS